MATDTKNSQEDAQNAAAKRINAALNQFRMLGNTVNWALDAEDREAMANAIEQGAVELVGKLRGNVASGNTDFTF